MNLGSILKLKTRYPAGEQNPHLRIGIARVKGAGRKWIDSAKVDNDYLPWMEWAAMKSYFLKMSRDQKVGIYCF